MVASEAIMVGGHPLSGTLQGAGYKVTRLGGWWTRPNVKRAELSRELADGDFPQPWHFEARYISIDGYVEAESHAQAHHIMDQLNGLAVARREYLTVQGHGVTQSALVEADGGALVETITDKLVRFELRFKANDPRKYGPLRTVEMDEKIWYTVRQYGNYPAAPFMTVRPDVTDPGYEVLAEMPDGTRRTWWYDTAVSIWNYIYFDEGRHLVGQTEWPRRQRRSETWMVPPHESIRVLVRTRDAATGTISGTLEYRDTWI